MNTCRFIIAFLASVTVAVHAGAAEITNARLGSGAADTGKKNVAVGCQAGIITGVEVGKSPDGNVSVGYAANFMSRATPRVAIGDRAGASGVGERVIAIGSMAGSSTQGDRMVLIGDNEYTNKYYSSGVTSINGGQIYINATRNEFAITAEQDAQDITTAPIYYRDGVVHINAKFAIDGGQSSADDSGSGSASLSEDIREYVDSKAFYTNERMLAGSSDFDLYMAPYGKDYNHGSMAYPKATFEGCIEALGAKGGKVCVLPGSYKPVALRPDDMGFLLYSPTGNCHFVALGGKSRTAIVGVYDNEDGFNDGYYHNLAFAKGNQTFEGFTITKIGCYRKTASSEGYYDTSPAFACLTLVNCEVVQCSMPVGFCFGAFNTCYITDTVIRDMSFTCYATAPGTELFSNCAILDSIVTRIGISGDSRAKVFGIATGAYYSVFDLPIQTSRDMNSGSNCQFGFCTFIWDEDSGLTNLRVSPEKANNCYFCVGDGTLSGGVSNVFASVSNTCLNADYIPNTISCPAVRIDGAPDAGWRDSGLSELKAMSLRPYLKMEDGGIGVYSNNTKIATITL